MPVLRTETLEGAALGMVTTRAPHELHDQEVAWLQDALIDQAGMVRRRNGIPAAGGSWRFDVATNAGATRYPQALATCVDPAGNARFAVLYFDNTACPGLYGAIYDTNLSLIGRQLMVPMAGLPSVGGVVGTLHVFTAQLPDGGCYITVAGSGVGLSANDSTSACVWYGAAPTGSYAGAALATPGVAISTLSVARNGTIVTMAAGDVTPLTPGMVIGIYNQVGVGIVRKIESATTVSLMAPYVGATLVTVATAKAMVTMNPLIFRSPGLVSASAGGTLTGYGTKFKTIMDAVNDIAWNGVVVSQVDGQVIATFTTSATTSDTNLGTVTVLRNASMEPYRILITGTSNPPAYLSLPNTSGNNVSLSDTGCMAFAYKGCTFWMNKANYLGATTFPTIKRDTPLSQRVWISGPSGPYDFDHSPADGAWFDVVSEIEGDQDIMCGGATPNVAIICKRKSTYVVVGDDPDSFQIVKLMNEGALQGSKVLPYQNGVIWFGPTGIWYYDGESKPENLVKENILPTYKAWARGNPNNYGAGSIATDHFAYYFRAFIYNDHLFLCMGGIPNYSPSVYSGHTASAQDTATMVMYLPNRAVSFWSNFKFVDFLPPQFNPYNIGYVLLEQATTTTWTMISLDEIMMPNSVFSGLQNDNFQVRGCVHAVGLTPSFFIETKRYGLSDPMNRKVWKGLAIEACFSDNSAHTSRVLVDYVQGLNATGTALATWFPDTGSNLIFKAQRVKARARNQYLGYRVYEDQTNKPKFLSLGAWQIMYKPGRAGSI